MTNRLMSKILVAGLACSVLLVLAAPAVAAPVTGTLDLSGTFTLATSFTNFCNTAGPCAAAPGNWNEPGSGTGDLATPYGNDPNGGLITNLSQAAEPVGTTVAPVLFLDFAPSGALPAPDIEFFITEIFAGVGGSANCGAAPAPGQTCTPSGSSATFLNNADGTSSVTITAAGIAERISSSQTDALTMVLTAQFDTPFQSILTGYETGITSTYSATFDASPAATVPEPLSLSLVGSGLIGIVLLRRRA